jgi:5-methylthioadenosine/S-adenosylhomocysteine deaminase
VVGGRIHDVDPAALAEGRHEWHTSIGRETLDENARLIETWHLHDGGRIRCDWAPHAPDTCSRDLLVEVASLAHRHGGNIHTHLAQSRGEVDIVRTRDGMSPAELLDQCGLLGPSTIAAHCIHLSEADIKRCGSTRIQVAHSPIGNARAGDIAPIMALAEAGARITLCTDTMSADMVEAMRWAISMQRVRGQSFVLDAATVLEWATLHGARALGMADQIGRIEAGFKADLVLFDRDSPTVAPMIDGAGIIVHSASGKDVHTVIIDGRTVLESGRLTLQDGEQIIREAQACAARLWQRAGRQLPA